MLRNVYISVLVIASLFAVSISSELQHISVKDNDWDVVENMFLERQAVEATKELTSLAKANPADSRVGLIFGALQLGRYESEKEWEQVKAAVEKLRNLLNDLWLSTNDPGVAVNLVEVSRIAFNRGFDTGGTKQSEFKQTAFKISQSDNASPQLFMAIAKLYRVAYGEQEVSERMLDSAEALLVKDSSDENLKLAIVYDRAIARVEREGYSPKAVGILQRVVVLDRKFGAESNKALNYLGCIALTQGNVGLAKTYLALAGRVRPDHVLTSFGYAKNLALEMIQQDYYDYAIEYLKIAYANEGRPKEETLYGLGMAYLGKGDKKAAIEWFEKYLELSYKPRAALVGNILNRIRDDESSKEVKDAKQAGQERNRGQEPFWLKEIGVRNLFGCIDRRIC